MFSRGAATATLTRRNMPWVSAESLFADQDQEEAALQPSPWLYRRNGPMR
jgi:hypothetical protein